MYLKKKKNNQFCYIETIVLSLENQKKKKKMTQRTGRIRKKKIKKWKKSRYAEGGQPLAGSSEGRGELKGI